MKPGYTFSAVCTSLVAILTIAATPEHPAITQYRAYVAAVRAGDEKALLAMAVPFSKPDQTLQLAHIRSNIAEEQLRKETVARLGPIDYKNDDGWLGTGIPPDEMIKDLKATEDSGLAGIMMKNPENGRMDLTVSALKKVNGKWLVPFGFEFNFEAGDNADRVFLETKGEGRDLMLRQFNATTKAVPELIKRLQNNEFKKRSEVLSALTAATAPRGEGAIDI